MHLSSGIAEIGPYQPGHPTAASCRCSRSRSSREVSNYTVFDVSDRLRQRGWLVPAYTFPENRQDLSVLRIVVRAGMNHEMADQLLEYLRSRPSSWSRSTRRSRARQRRCARPSRTDAADRAWPIGGEVNCRVAGT